MALFLKVSNSLEKLAQRLSSDMRDFPGDIFQPDFIITQTSGMNNWLRIRIAEHNGITANIRFLKPNDIIYQIYFRLDGPKERVLAADNLQWVLFTELDDAGFKRRYPNIAAYYKNNDEVKRLGLASKVSDLFDQYQIYRPDMIREWNTLELSNDAVTWQAWLWIKTKKSLGSRIPDKTLIADFVINALNQPENQNKIKERLPRIHLFGISILTAFHIDLFRKLGEYIDICFYLLNPAPQLYWYEDRSPSQIARWMQRSANNGKFEPPIEGNTLLTNWGKVIRDTFSLLFKHEEILDRYDDSEVELPVPDTLLKKIQFDLFNNAVEEDRQVITSNDLNDHSLTFHACYTPAREVEVFYNYLVRQVETGKVTSPRDVVVMVNDIDTYAPYIRAVFKSAPYSFPFIIADEHVTVNEGFFNALQAIMNLNSDEFKAEEILQLLELGYIRQRFNITNTDLIRQAVNTANIRFGISGSELDESVTLSWENGLKRIMYGICMSDPAEYLGDGYGFYPLDLAEGESALELVKFTHFIQVLISVCREQEQNRTLAEWSQYLEESVRRLLFTGANDDDPDYILFLDYLERLNLISETMGEKVSFKVFRQSFINEMSGETRPGNFISGGITFCSLIPMRSIPFKTVAILGLNYDKFPRKESPVTFDLIKAKPKPGDRDVRENDKHLFLETLLSAKERLYISYIGRNSKDNTVQPPSAMIDELLDYITDDPASLIQLHPLHSFSSKYSETDNGLYTYLTDQELPVPASNKTEAKTVDFSDINIESFIAFFKNPFKAYYNKVLGIYYQEESLLLGDTEIFEHDKLQEWSLKKDLLFLDDASLPDYRNKGVKTGNLPLKNMADLILEKTYNSISEVKELVKECVGESLPQKRQVEIDLDGSILNGSIFPLYGQVLMIASLSKNEAKYCLEAYILHLIAAAAECSLDTHYISGTTLEKITLPSVTKETALEKLKIFLELYKRGHTEPLVFSTDFRLDIVKLDSLSHDKFLSDLKKATGERGWLNDAYILKEYENGFFENPECFEACKINTRDIYVPVYQIFNR